MSYDTMHWITNSELPLNPNYGHCYEKRFSTFSYLSRSELAIVVEGKNVVVLHPIAETHTIFSNCGYILVGRVITCFGNDRMG